MTAINAFSIGPSLHDWQYEEFSEQAAMREEALEHFRAYPKTLIESSLIKWSLFRE